MALAASLRLFRPRVTLHLRQQRWKKRAAIVDRRKCGWERGSKGQVRNYRGAKKFRIGRITGSVPTFRAGENELCAFDRADESLEVNVLFESSKPRRCSPVITSRNPDGTPPVRVSSVSRHRFYGSWNARNCAKKETGRNVEFHHYHAFALLFLRNGE